MPGDISSAAFFLVGAIITANSELHLREVGLNPTRTGLLDALRAMGPSLSESEVHPDDGEPYGNLTARSAELTSTTVEGAQLVRMIDEVPVFAIAAMRARGTTRIQDASELRVKESDRLETTAGLVRAFGGDARIEGDTLIIQGGTDFQPATINSRGDHRIAMAAAIAACAARGDSTIQDIECIETSYPQFFEHLEACTEVV